MNKVNNVIRSTKLSPFVLICERQCRSLLQRHVSSCLELVLDLDSASGPAIFLLRHVHPPLVFGSNEFAPSKYHDLGHMTHMLAILCQPTYIQSYVCAPVSQPAE